MPRILRRKPAPPPPPPPKCEKSKKWDLNWTLTMLNAIRKPDISSSENLGKFQSFEDPLKEIYENAVLPTAEEANLAPNLAPNSNSNQDLDPWLRYFQDSMTESDEDDVEYETKNKKKTSDSDSDSDEDEDLGKVKLEDCVDPSWPSLAWRMQGRSKPEKRKMPPPNWFPSRVWSCCGVERKLDSSLPYPPPPPSHFYQPYPYYHPLPQQQMTSSKSSNAPKTATGLLYKPMIRYSMNQSFCSTHLWNPPTV